MELVEFTDKDIEIGPILGPEYCASNRLAEAMLEKFDTEHLKPLVDKAADEFREKLWDDVRDWLLADTEQNVSGAVRHMVEQTVQALLTGRQWAMDRYPYADYSRGDDVRAAVCKHGGDTLMSRRVADLEAELAKRDETIRFLRDSRY